MINTVGKIIAAKGQVPLLVSNFKTKQQIKLWCDVGVDDAGNIIINAQFGWYDQVCEKNFKTIVGEI